MIKYQWVSSKEPINKDILTDLDKRMRLYYGTVTKRMAYDRLLEKKGLFPEPDGAESDFLNWFKGNCFKRVLEVGCGQGWLGKRIFDINPLINYTGLEVSSDIISSNMARIPHLNWIEGVVYNLDTIEGDFDLVFSFYVLEHLVFPELGLSNMMSKVKPGGCLFLVFPDFIQKKALPSQKLGFSCLQNAKIKFNQGRYFDALFSFVENRLIARPKLNKIKTNLGQFMINTRPICLDKGCQCIWPDSDAVYIASKEEVMHWAMKNSFKAILPFGSNGFYANHACVVLQKEFI